MQYYNLRFRKTDEMPWTHLIIASDVGGGGVRLPYNLRDVGHCAQCGVFHPEEEKEANNEEIR